MSVGEWSSVLKHLGDKAMVDILLTLSPSETETVGGGVLDMLKPCPGLTRLRNSLAQGFLLSYRAQPFITATEC